METEYTDDMGSDIAGRDTAFEPIDWRAEYRDHPWVFLGAAVGIGVILGTMIRPSTRSAIYQNRTAPLRQALHTSPKVAQLKSTWGLMSDALLGVATAKAVDAIGGYIPGFRDEYQKHTSRHGGAEPAV